MPSEADLREEITGQIRDLVRIPSQGFLDPLDGIFDGLTRWLGTQSLRWEPLRDASGQTVALLVTLDTGRPGPVICLDACVDTAPAGRRELWAHDPFAGAIEGGRLYGRGAADSKAAVAIFCHLARDLERSGVIQRGTLHLLLDGDEHTGNFGGAKAFVERTGGRVSFMAIGYPGNQKIAIGSRGLFRTTLRTFGDEMHSGSAFPGEAQSSILKMARLVERLARQRFPREDDPDFSFGPSLNVTEIRGGDGFSQLPGVCRANVDLRLTPGFAAEAARRCIQEHLREIDHEIPSHQATEAEERESWPPYRLGRNLPALRILQQCAEQAFSKSVSLAVSRMSNIGNYLAALGIPATCGLGVAYEHLHAPEESIELSSIVPTYLTYREAARRWMEELPEVDPGPRDKS